MDVDKDALGRLRALGLSDYAARAYLAALRLGKSDAKGISALAKVPPSKVYDVLGTLERVGLLEVFPEFPKKYGALSLESYIDRLVSEHRGQAERIAQDRDELLRVFAPAAAAAAQAGGSVVTLRGKARVFERIRAMLRDSTKSWVVMGALGAAERIPDVLDELRAAHARGVRMRFLTPMDTPADDVDRLAAIGEARLRAASGGRADHVALMVADGTHALLVHWGGQSGEPGTADTAIATDDPAIAAALESLVNVFWTGASALPDRRHALDARMREARSTLERGEDRLLVALHEALDSGVKRVLAVTGVAAGRSRAFEVLRERGAAVNAVLDVRNSSEAARALDMAQSWPGLELRHLPAGTPSRFFILGSEAVYSLGRPGEPDELVVRTNEPAVVATLTRHFEDLWGRAQAIGERARTVGA